MKTIITMLWDRNRRWIWHAKRAGRIVAFSGESYSSRTKCRTSLNRFVKSIEAGQVEYRNLFRDTKSEH